MGVNGSIVLDLWELMVEYIPSGKKDDVANKIVMIFADGGMDEDEFDSIRGEDIHLDSAIDNYFSDSSFEEDIDYESVDYDN